MTDAAAEGAISELSRVLHPTSGQVGAFSELSDFSHIGEWLATTPSFEVAPRLLGALLTTRGADGEVAVRITEVEAYDGANDPGSHAYRGQTRRNATMFGPAGHLYVYRHLGLHLCMNVVCGPEGRAAAVLLRAGEVVAGEPLAMRRRNTGGVCRAPRDLARGPARLTQALGITIDDDGANLLSPAGRLFLNLSGEQTDLPGVSSGPRVGVSGPGGDATQFPWRFWLTGDPTVSTYRAATPRRRESR